MSLKAACLVAGGPGLSNGMQREPDPRQRGPRQLGPLAWLQSRLQPGRQQAMSRSDYVKIDFRGSARRGINPFKPTSWPQLDVNIGTFWGLLVLSLAYVHHSTAGYAVFMPPSSRASSDAPRPHAGCPLTEELTLYWVARQCSFFRGATLTSDLVDDFSPLPCRFALPALLPLITPDLNLTDHEGALLTVGYTVGSRNSCPELTAGDACMIRCSWRGCDGCEFACFLRRSGDNLPYAGPVCSRARASRIPCRPHQPATHAGGWPWCVEPPHHGSLQGKHSQHPCTE